MKKNAVFYYSGTGNSLASAKTVASAIDAELIAITAEIIDEKFAGEFNVCVVFLPSYAYGIPALVRRFIKKCAVRADYLAVAVTYGSTPLGTAAEAVRLYKRKKQPVSLTFGIKSVENFVQIFGLPSEEEIKPLQDTQREKTAELCELISARATNKIRLFTPVSSFVTFFFRLATPLLAALYRSKNCNGCGYCRRICPANAIKITQKKGKHKPKISAFKCGYCQSCAQLCPHKAIKALRISPNSRRYRHTDTAPSEFIKRD